MIGYPAYHGLPKYEATRFLLEDQEDFSVQKHQDYDFFKTPDKAAVWFAGKELFPEKVLSDYIGKNEKTKIIIKLTPAGSGCPVREPLIK